MASSHELSGWNVLSSLLQVYNSKNLTWNFWDCNGFKFVNPPFAGRGDASQLCSSLYLVSIFLTYYLSRELTWTSFSLCTPCWSRLLLYYLLGTSGENHMQNVLSRCSLLDTWARTLYKRFIVCLVSAVLIYDQVEYIEAGLPNTHKISIQFLFHLQLSDFKIEALNF